MPNSINNIYRHKLYSSHSRFQVSVCVATMWTKTYCIKLYCSNNGLFLVFRRSGPFFFEVEVP